MTTNPDDKKPKQVLATYAVIALIVMFLLNIFVLPGIMERSIRETTYSDFLKGIDSKQIQEVQFDVQDSIIYYTIKQDGKTQVCKTGLINTDSELIDKITSSGADLTSEIPTQQSPLMNMLIGFILPTIIFIFLGQLLFKKMTNSMTGGPGGAMSFGKSNAKVYVKSSTGIKFSDVAGEDEAKELLTEIVDFLHNPEKYRAIGATMPKGALLVGPPGTGKTLLTLAAGLTHTMEQRRFNEIIITRATISVGEDIGFLPGTEEEKMAPWLGAIDDNLEVLNRGSGNGSDWGRRASEDLIRSRIRIKSMSFMRGRTFLNKFVIIDEAQNLTPKQMKTLITRAGPGTKIVCLGNIAQIDTPYLTEGSSGLTYVVDRFKGWPHSGHITMQRGERSRLADFASDTL